MAAMTTPDLVSADDATLDNLNLTFISIHDLSPEARILYSSESIVDVLGYTPDEIVNRSVWEFFSEEEVPYAKQYHKNGIEMDKAAMLAYCRVKDREGQWIGCECCFTIVYDVMVVCTSVYRSGINSEKRAMQAPVIRRLFSSSPRDPRYHMLSHISQKFQNPQKQYEHEPRAALFLNRFTRTLTIMYATSGIEDVIGITSSGLQGKSFYYCIEENCLADAVKCLEQAKGNDSIAYLRFWFRDPRAEDPETGRPDDSDDEMTTDTSVDSEMGGGVNLSPDESHSEPESRSRSTAIQSDESMDVDQPSSGDEPQSRTSSGDSGRPVDSHEAIFGTARASVSSISSAPDSPEQGRHDNASPIELEAVISCASDGLVVCLRRARHTLPHGTATYPPSRTPDAPGIFAAPWAEEPYLPSPSARHASHQQTPSFAPSLSPHGARHHPIHDPNQTSDDFMTAIREQAIFAWALSSINGSLQRFGLGEPLGESVPASGLPIWQSDKDAFASKTSAAQPPHSSTSEISVSGGHSSDSHGQNRQGTGSDHAMTDAASSSTITQGLSDGGSPGHTRDSDRDPPVGNDHRRLFGDPGIRHARGSSGGGSAV